MKRCSKAEPQYAFSLKNYQLLDLAEMCVYHQTSEHSNFTQKRICSIATLEGRVSITDDRLIVTDNTQNIRCESRIESEQDYRFLLKCYFGVSLF